VGVTPTTITVEIMADIGAASIPGMADGSVQAIQSWAKLVNSKGGLACRQVKVRVFDSKIDPTQSSAGYLDGCENAFAMVGTYALAVSDVSTLDSCKDMNGNPTGLPETPGVALNPLQACNKTDFLYGSTGAPCPAGTGTQTFTETSAYNQYIKQALGSGSTHGSYYVALTPPVIKDTAVPSYLYMQNQGAKADQMVGLPATATQANFTPIISKMVSSKSQFYFSDSVFPTFLEAKAEAAAQGVSSKVLWLCQTTCYTPAFAKRQRLLTPEQYEIVDVCTSRGMSRAMLFSKAITLPRTSALPVIAHCVPAADATRRRHRGAPELRLWRRDRRRGRDSHLRRHAPPRQVHAA